jgi:hypothetical protein
LLEAIPERNRPCERGTGADGFWMRDIGAQEQANCRLAADQTTPALVGGSLQYGRFASPAAARAGLGDSESFARKTDRSVPCDGATRQRMRALYARGRVTCLRNTARGFVIEWNDDGSAVMGHMTYDAPTAAAAAVRSWAKTL